MRARYGGNLLWETTQELIRVLEGLRHATPLELIEAELEIPFIGKPAGDTSPASLAGFRDVSVIAEDIGASGVSDIWRIRISIMKDRAAILRVERYDTPAAS